MSIYQFCPSPDLSTKEQTYTTWENGFSDSEIASIIELGNSLTLGNGTVEGTKENTAIRKSTVGWIVHSQDSTFLYDRLAYITRMLNGQFFDFDLYGFVEDLQYTVYNSNNDHYNWHMDKGVASQAPRKLSLVLQLSDPSEYEGGDIEFMLGGENLYTAEKKKGLLYAFPSWILHRVTPVTAGTRKSLVAWVAGPKFR
jgi:PKHD-type hydroxylase